MHMFIYNIHIYECTQIPTFPRNILKINHTEVLRILDTWLGGKVFSSLNGKLKKYSCWVPFFAPPPHLYTYICIYIYTYSYIHIYIYVYIFVCKYLYIYVYIYMYMYILLNIVCIYIYVYVYIFTYSMYMFFLDSGRPGVFHIT